MDGSLWLIGLVFLVMLAVGAGIAWFLMGRRPVKFDARHERVVQMLTRLHQDNPRKAMDVVARALVRGGLVWEADLQTSGQGSVPSGARPGGQARTGEANGKRSSGGERYGGQPQSDGGRAPTGGQGAPSAGTGATSSREMREGGQRPPGGTGKDAGGRQPHRRRRRRPKVGAQPAPGGSGG